MNTFNTSSYIGCTKYESASIRSKIRVARIIIIIINYGFSKIVDMGNFRKLSEVGGHLPTPDPSFVFFLQLLINSLQCIIIKKPALRADFYDFVRNLVVVVIVNNDDDD